MAESLCLALSPRHFRAKAPRALGKAGIPARRDLYLMPNYVHPASPTAIGILKNLTEKIGAHTLFYDQKKQIKTTANNRHSFCRFCARAIWWSPRRRSHETAPRSGTTCLHSVVEKHIYRQSLNCRNKIRGTQLSPAGSARQKYSLRFPFAPSAANAARKKQGRHSSAFGNSHYIRCPLPMCLDCKFT